MNTVVKTTDFTDLPDDIQQSAFKIAASWRKSTEAIIETGVLLNQVEKDLTQSQYILVRNYLINEAGISNTVLSKLKTIARNPVLLDPKYHDRLPPSYATLYQISKIDKDKLTTALEEKAITNNSQLKDITAKFGPLTKRTNSKSAKPQGPTLTIIYNGDPIYINREAYAKLKEIISSLKSERKITIKTKGI